MLWGIRRGKTGFLENHPAGSRLGISKNDNNSSSIEERVIGRLRKYSG
jgi:hypothetical protein